MKLMIVFCVGMAVGALVAQRLAAERAEAERVSDEERILKTRFEQWRSMGSRDIHYSTASVESLVEFPDD